MFISAHGIKMYLLKEDKLFLFLRSEIMRSCDGNWSCEEQAYTLVSQEKVADTYKSNLEKFMESRIKIYIFVQ